MKKLLSILFILIGIVANSQNTKITAPISTNSLTDTTYSVTYDSLVKGGYRVLVTTGQRDSIPQAERKYGMQVYVKNTDSVYQLKSATLDNSNWYAFKLGSSSAYALDSTAWHNGGNSFGSTASLGTNDNNDVIFKRNISEVFRLNYYGGFNTVSGSGWQLGYYNTTAYTVYAQQHLYIPTDTALGINSCIDCPSIMTLNGNLTFSPSQGTYYQVALTKDIPSFTPYTAGFGLNLNSYQFKADTSKLLPINDSGYRYTTPTQLALKLNKSDSALRTGYVTPTVLTNDSLTIMTAVNGKLAKAYDTATNITFPDETFVPAAPTSGIREFVKENKFGYINSLNKEVQFSTTLIGAGTAVIDSMPSTNIKIVGRYNQDTIGNKLLSIGYGNTFVLPTLSNGFGVTSLAYTGGAATSVTVDSTVFLPRADSISKAGYVTPTVLSNDSLTLATAINGKGTVTSVATTNGLGISSSVANSSTTPNITIAVDTSNASILSRQRASATYTTLSSLSATCNVSTGSIFTYNSATGAYNLDTTKLQKLTAGSNITITSNAINADTTTGATKLATQGYVFRNSGSGTVTSVATGFGLLGGTITTTGTLTVDSSAVPTVTQTFSPIITLTDGSTITWDARNGCNAKVTLAGTGRTLTVSNAVAGRTYHLDIYQDGTGSRTITTYTNFISPAGVIPNLTTTASARDEICMFYDGTKFTGVWVLNCK